MQNLNSVMWPSSRANRARLAVHLIVEAKTDPMKLLSLLERGITCTVCSGICTIENGISFEADMANLNEDKSSTVPGSSLTALALHVLWIVFPSTTMATFVQSKCIASHSPFWTTLYSWVSFIVAAPAVITNTLHIGRPDLSWFVSKLYLEWLAMVRSPGVIEAQLDRLLKETWAYSTYSDEWRHIETALLSFGIMCNKRPLKTSSLTLNGIGGVVISQRDKVMMALFQLFMSPLKWATICPPDTAPQIFKDIHTELQTNSSNSRPAPIDELYERSKYIEGGSFTAM